MKVLVTGSNGFLGAALVERLLAHGYTDIRCLVRPGSSRARLEAVQQKFPQVSLDLFVGTLASPEAVMPALDGVETIFHLAAGMSGAAADLFLSSVVASKNLLEAVVRTRPIKIVQVSSFGVYAAGKLPRGSVIDENTPLEPHPEKRDLYSYAKLRQEQLFWEYHRTHQIPLVVLRPGVIYGPSGPAISSRVGLNLFGVFLHLGGNNILPLSYVDNCAEAIVVAGKRDEANGQAYNVHDDDLPTCREFLQRYKREVRSIRSVSLPLSATMTLSRVVEKYHVRSRGQLPAVFTPYKTAASWQGNRFDNGKLKRLGWAQLVPTNEAIQRTFLSLQSARR